MNSTLNSSSSSNNFNNKNKFVRLSYNRIEFKLTFHNEDNKYINISDGLSISNDIIYKELTRNRLDELDKKNHYFKDDIHLDRDKITSQLLLLQRIIDSHSIESLKDDIITKMVDYVPFFLTLNLISLVDLILNLIRNLITENKLFIYSNEDKEKIYIGITHTIALIQKELISIKCSNNDFLQLINSLMKLYNKSINIIFSILISINKTELELFISNIKKEYLKIDDANDKENNFASFISNDMDYYLLINLLKIIIITLINNREISFNDKLDILKDLVINDNKVIRINTCNNSNQFSFLDISHEMFTFFDKSIYSSVLTQAYNSVIIMNKNNFNNHIKIVRVILDLSENDNTLCLDQIALTDKLNTFDKLFDFNMAPNNSNSELELEFFKFANKIKELKKENVLLEDKNKQQQVKIEELLKEKEELTEKNQKLTMRTIEMNKAVENLDNIIFGRDTYNIPSKNINEIIEYFKNSFPVTLAALKELNYMIYNRGYIYNNLKTLVLLINFYNSENSDYNNEDLDMNVFEALGKLNILISCYYCYYY